MRNGQNKRMRGRNRNNNHNNKSHHSGGHHNNHHNHNPLTRVYESNGPEVKIRGNAHHITEKYLQLARDATASGDYVTAENHHQHAEHYFRLIAAAQEQFRQQNPYYQAPPAPGTTNEDGSLDDDGNEGDQPNQGQPMQGQPQQGHPQGQPQQGQPQQGQPNFGNQQNYGNQQPPYPPREQPQPYQPQPQQGRPQHQPHQQYRPQHQPQPQPQPQNYQQPQSYQSQPQQDHQPQQPNPQPSNDSSDGERLPSFITGGQPPQYQGNPNNGGQNGYDNNNQGERFGRHRRRRHRGAPRPDLQGAPQQDVRSEDGPDDTRPGN